MLNLGQGLADNAVATSELPTTAGVAPEIGWEINDRCLAPWEDGVPYVAKITDISGSNITVLFLEYFFLIFCTRVFCFEFNILLGTETLQLSRLLN